MSVVVANTPQWAEERIKYDLGAFVFDKIENLPNWRDVAPRFGAVYDLFDDGKTALKGHVGKYMRAFSTVGFAALYNPMVTATDRRTWTDRNGDDIAQDNEIGVNTPFNISGISNRIPDPDIRRPYQLEYSAGVQREVMPGVSVSFNWVRRTFRRLTWRENLRSTGSIRSCRAGCSA